MSLWLPLLAVLYSALPAVSSREQQQPETPDWRMTLKTIRNGVHKIDMYLNAALDLLGGEDGLCQHRCRDGSKPTPRYGYKPSPPNGCGSPVFGFHPCPVCQCLSCARLSAKSTCRARRLLPTPVIVFCLQCYQQPQQDTTLEWHLAATCHTSLTSPSEAPVNTKVAAYSRPFQGSLVCGTVGPQLPCSCQPVMA
ncbi:group XIIA secretory phospholipase A2 isoform X1 [Dendrobates tinctorius]|uniref:group XIIA secretory phospholipase A2 isoform X1 n=1 Tax=Dendrobates tinctorius TaxID=92724 RepID=UPI003CC96874